MGYERKMNERQLLGEAALLSRTRNRAQLNSFKINDPTWIFLLLSGKKSQGSFRLTQFLFK